MTNITNLRENDYERMEGTFFCECFDKEISIEYDKNLSLEDVNKAIKHFYYIYPKLLDTLCKNTNDYRKETMELYPDVDYKVGLYTFKSDFDILNYIGIEGLKLEFRNGKVAFNLRGCCDWTIEEDLQWIIYEDKVVYVGPWYDFTMNSKNLYNELFNYCVR